MLSSLPQKILRVVSAFGWKADKHLGFALLKLSLEGRRIRSPTASLMYVCMGGYGGILWVEVTNFKSRLLAYYTVLTSLCPQTLANEYTQPAIEVSNHIQCIKGEGLKLTEYHRRYWMLNAPIRIQRSFCTLLVVHPDLLAT